MNCLGLLLLMNCLRLQPEVFVLLLRLEPKTKKFPVLTALAKAIRNKSDFIFWLKPRLTQTNLRLKPEAIHKQKRLSRPTSIHHFDSPNSFTVPVLIRLVIAVNRSVRHRSMF